MIFETHAHYDDDRFKDDRDAVSYTHLDVYKRQDLQFIKELEPHMVGIGPFISQKDTPFANEKSGTMDETLRLLSILSLIHI